MSLKHRAPQVLVAEQFRPGAQDISGWKQMRGERVPQRIAAGKPVDAGISQSLL